MKLNEAKNLKPGTMVVVGNTNNKGFLVVAAELKKSASGRSIVYVTLKEALSPLYSSRGWPLIDVQQAGQVRWPYINAQQSHLNIRLPTQAELEMWKTREDAVTARLQANEEWQKNEKAKRDASAAAVKQLKATFDGSKLSTICNENGVDHEKLNVLKALLLAAEL